MRLTTLCFLACALAAVACSSRESQSNSEPGVGDGGAPQQGQETKLDLFCELSGVRSDRCSCALDYNDVYPGPGIAECSTESIGNGVCCANAAYPGAGTCSCERWGCFESDTTCRCGHVESAQSAASCVKDWPYCCATKLSTGEVGMCSCYNFESACDEVGQQRVASCSIARATCEPEGIQVSSCTADCIEDGQPASCARAAANENATAGAAGTAGHGGNTVGGAGGQGGVGGAGATGGSGGSAGGSAGSSSGSFECPRGSRFCSDDKLTLMTCNRWDGETVSMECVPRGKYCDDTFPGCRTHVCPPGEVSCDVNWRTGCNDLGSSFTDRLEDCRSSDLFCSAGQCSSDAVDFVANYEPKLKTWSAYVGTGYGNMYAVDVTRRLIEYGMPFSPGSYTDGPFEFRVYRWVEPTDGTNPWQQAFELIKYSYPDNDPDDFYSTGPIDVLLEAGEVYLISIVHDFSYLQKEYYRDGDVQDVTFGQVLGGTYGYSGASRPSDNEPRGFRFTQRLTTTTP